MFEISIRDWCGYLQAPKTRNEALATLGRFIRDRKSVARAIERSVNEGYKAINFDESNPSQKLTWAALCHTIHGKKSSGKKGTTGLDAVIFQLPDNRGRKISVRKRDMYPRSPKDPRWNKSTDGVWEGFQGMRRILEARETVSSTSRWTESDESMHENNKRPLIREQTLSLLEQAGYSDTVPYTPKEFYDLLGKIRKHHQSATEKKEVALLKAVITALESDEALFRYERPTAAVYRDERGYELFRLPLH